MSFQEFFDFQLLSIGDYTLSVGQVAIALLILLGTRLLYLTVARIIRRRFARKPDSDLGRLYAFKQITKYILYVIGTLAALQVIGVQLSVIWASAAALLVGLGLGMQQTFNDLVSGVILLIEGTVEVDDVVNMNGLIGKVTQIGIRTSKIKTQNDDYILVPNSKLVVENVQNLSYNEAPNRFQIKVGVAYGSDVEMVSELLLKAAEIHPDVVNSPSPLVQFIEFGNSSLDFILHFYSSHYMEIPRIQSDMRFTINQLFKEAEITIPFPQREVWLRNEQKEA